MILGFFRTIRTMPWLAEQSAIDNQGGGATLSVPSEKIFLVIFMVIVVVLFSLFGVAYKIRMSLGDWMPLPEPQILWANTAVLVFASVAFHLAQKAVRLGQMERARNALIAAGALSFAFLAGQLFAWQQLVETGYLVAVNPANAFFYLITALHGLHLMGGLVAWMGATTRIWSKTPDTARSVLSIELCTMYWHFLLAVWAVLFGLLLFT